MLSFSIACITLWDYCLRLRRRAAQARWFLAHGDATYLKSFQEFAREIPESELQPGDVILYKQPRFAVHHHGGIVVSWPDQIVHAIRNIGVTLGHATQEGFLKNCERKCFTFVKES